MNENIPYIVFESEMARMERTIKRLWILVIVFVGLFVGTNLAWLGYESQYKDVITTIEQDVDTTSGGNAVVNGTGDLTYGKD